RLDLDRLVEHRDPIDRSPRKDPQKPVELFRSLPVAEAIDASPADLADRIGLVLQVRQHRRRDFPLELAVEAAAFFLCDPELLRPFERLLGAGRLTLPLRLAPHFNVEQKGLIEEDLPQAKVGRSELRVESDGIAP